VGNQRRILSYEAKRPRNLRAVWRAFQIVLSFLIAIALVRSIFSPDVSPVTAIVPPARSTTSALGVVQADPFTAALAPEAAPPTSSDVSEGLFLLLRSQDITSETFSCPTTQPTKWDFDNENAGTTHEVVPATKPI
jgi:hypothetical protein